MTGRLVVLLAVLALPTARAEAQVAAEGSGSLVAFQSDRELADYLRNLAEERQRRMQAEAERVQALRKCGSIRVARRGAPLDAMDSRAAVIHGDVVDESGSPIAQVTVSIDSLGISAVTDDDGEFTLAVPRARLTRRHDWTIRARRLGHLAREHVVRIGPRDSLEVEVTLCASGIALQEVRVSGAYGASAASSEVSITNTQHAGVDEGGIVKVHGGHFVMLRRGRLFTVRVNDLHPVSMVDAFGPGIDPRGAWYDELLISGDKVVVVGYSYASRGTEIGIFRIDDAGELRYVSTYHLRSNDYYSSRNYASRLLGTKLVFYTPQYLWYDPKDPLVVLPAMRRWHGGGREDEFKRIVASTRVYRPAVELDPEGVSALHTVTICDLAAPELECEATAVLGPPGRVFYVAPSAVYTWLSPWRRRGESDSALATLYRMPLDGSAPKAVRVSGSPVDQFSFLETDDGHLNVVVRGRARGDAMWQAERTGGEVALLRLPLESFGDGRRSAERSLYRELPRPAGGVFVNRFVGDHLLYGTGNSWGPPRKTKSVLHVVAWRNADATPISLPHGTDRIEVMGGDAVVIGTDGKDLHFSGIRLDGAPEVALRHTMPNAAQGELRSHGFFYKPNGPSSGILGLPVRAGGSAGYQHLRKSSASILFLKNAERRFTELGKLEADVTTPADDACAASCVDWYGNARPIFVAGRILALLGYELVEGRVDDAVIREVRRVSFAPPRVRAVDW